MLRNDFRCQFVNPVKNTPTYGDLGQRNKITVVKGMFRMFLAELLITKLEESKLPK